MPNTHEKWRGRSRAKNDSQRYSRDVGDPPPVWSVSVRLRLVAASDKARCFRNACGESRVRGRERPRGFAGSVVRSSFRLCPQLPHENVTSSYRSALFPNKILSCGNEKLRAARLAAAPKLGTVSSKKASRLEASLQSQAAHGTCTDATCRTSQASLPSPRAGVDARRASSSNSQRAAAVSTHRLSCFFVFSGVAEGGALAERERERENSAPLCPATRCRGVRRSRRPRARSRSHSRAAAPTTRDARTGARSTRTARSRCTTARSAPSPRTTNLPRSGRLVCRAPRRHTCHPSIRFGLSTTRGRFSHPSQKVPNTKASIPRRQKGAFSHSHAHTHTHTHTHPRTHAHTSGTAEPRCNSISPFVGNRWPRPFTATAVRL